MDALTEVAFQRGQHALVFGERGVGKTSIAKVMAEILGGSFHTLHFTCDSGDDYGTIWRRMLEEIRLTTMRPGIGFAAQLTPVVQSADTMLAAEVSPNTVRRVLSILAEIRPMVIFIDEFDRPRDAATRTRFADTIKILSDQAIGATLVLIGVADTVEELLAEHASIQRSLVQVQMPRMTDSELRQIVERGIEAAEMTIDDGIPQRLVALSQGLPHYTHLLSQHAARAAVIQGRAAVDKSDLDAAVQSAVGAAQESVRQRYYAATSSSRETLYGDVLLACALARKDELGMFGAPDVRDELQKLTDRPYDIPAFAAHLNDFSGSGPRGGVLQKRGTRGRFRYRFRDPLLPPHVVMRGVVSGRVPDYSFARG
jgi:hypothetical protein